MVSLSTDQEVTEDIVYSGAKKAEKKKKINHTYYEASKIKHLNNTETCAVFLMKVSVEQTNRNNLLPL